MTRRSDVLVCVCNTVLESQIVACARKGARTLAEVAIACDAGTGCGSCRGAITTILEEEEARRRRGESIPEAILQLPLFAGVDPRGSAGPIGGAGRPPKK